MQNKNELAKQKEAKTDFWSQAQWDYDPIKFLEQIPNGKFPLPKITMNGDDNFAGGILESSDRNILMPSYN